MFIVMIASPLGLAPLSGSYICLCLHSTFNFLSDSQQRCTHWHGYVGGYIVLSRPRIETQFIRFARGQHKSLAKITNHILWVESLLLSHCEEWRWWREACWWSNVLFLEWVHHDPNKYPLQLDVHHSLWPLVCSAINSESMQLKRLSEYLTCTCTITLSCMQPWATNTF